MSDKLIHHISGEFVTNFAREKYKDTRSLKEAVSILTQMLIGFPEDLAEQVVRGKKKLVGDNEVYIEDDDTEVILYGTPRPIDISQAACGWIAPDGSVVYGMTNHTSTCEHNDIADELVRYGIAEDTSHNPYHSLEEQGWIKFSPDLVCAIKLPSVPGEVKCLIFEWMDSQNVRSVTLGASIGSRTFTKVQIANMSNDDFSLRIIGM